MIIRPLIFLSTLFVTLTSVYCERDLECSGTVYDADTGEALDSVTVDVLGNKSYTDQNGTYSRHVTVKGKEPWIQFSKDSVGSVEIIGCEKDATIYL